MRRRVVRRDGSACRVVGWDSAMQGEDRAIERAIEAYNEAKASDRRPAVAAFPDAATGTISYVVADPVARRCVIIDAMLGYDAASATVSREGADEIAAFVEAEDLTTVLVLETHIHADHLSATRYLADRLGVATAMGAGLVEVHRAIGGRFDTGPRSFDPADAFDRLLDDGEGFAVGSIDATVIHVPGHTPACAAYAVGDALFCGDTLFMPDYGTARCDFPGGSAARMFASIGRLLRLPDGMRVFVGHDYGTVDRPGLAWETTIAAQRADNVHVGGGVDEAAFVALREGRDAALRLPALILPSMQVNLRGGRLPEAEANGMRYMKLPMDASWSRT